MCNIEHGASQCISPIAYKETTYNTTNEVTRAAEDDPGAGGGASNFGGVGGGLEGHHRMVDVGFATPLSTT